MWRTSAWKNHVLANSPTISASLTCVCSGILDPESRNNNWEHHCMLLPGVTHCVLCIRRFMGPESIHCNCCWMRPEVGIKVKYSRSTFILKIVDENCPFALTGQHGSHKFKSHHGSLFHELEKVVLFPVHGILCELLRHHTAHTSWQLSGGVFFHKKYPQKWLPISYVAAYKGFCLTGFVSIIHEILLHYLGSLAPS